MSNINTEIINARKSKVLLVYPEKILEITTVGTNIQATNLVPHIEAMQDLKIKKILGRTLYNELFDAYVAANQIPDDIDDGSLTGGINYKELYYEIVKPLIWWSYTDFIVENHYKVVEKGVQLNYSDYGDNSAKDGVQLIEGRIKTKAQIYTEELQKYLNDLFKNDETFEEESQEEGGYFDNIYYPSKRKGCKSYRYDPFNRY